MSSEDKFSLGGHSSALIRHLDTGHPFAPNEYDVSYRHFADILHQVEEVPFHSYSAKLFLSLFLRQSLMM